MIDYQERCKLLEGLLSESVECVKESAKNKLFAEARFELIGLVKRISCALSDSDIHPARKSDVS